MEWFEGLKGWKSTQGGFSAVSSITTDENDMGGFFVRKVAGAAIMGTHLHKLIPILFHPKDAQWKRGHFRPLLWTSVIANLLIIAFVGAYVEDLFNAGAGFLVKLMIAALSMESAIIIFYLVSQKATSRGPAIAMKDGQTEKSIPSRILARTVTIVSGLVVLIAGRDFFFPGHALPFPPRDDIYLEWTGAFIHSPPPGSQEAAEQGIAASLQVGRLYMSQFMALHMLILCMYKFSSTFFIRMGSDGSGTIKAKMMWIGAFCGDAMFLFVLRVFNPPALSASLDLRWHLMCIGYEALILGTFSPLRPLLHCIRHTT
jgi:hypothetical protein